MEWFRSSGVLLHPTSLPHESGLGQLGDAARRFIDRLADAGQSWWQILPLHPTDGSGSPYASPSAFAGNPALVDLEGLVSQGLLSSEEISDLRRVVEMSDERRSPRAAEARLRMLALDRAFEHFEPDDDYGTFCTSNAHWLEDWALFDSLKDKFDGRHWKDWPAEVVARAPSTLKTLKRALREPIAHSKFRQWIFETQWQALRDYARDRGIQIIGDVPIFPAMDSADAWAHRAIFEIDAAGNAEVVAGVPPDYFSETGQKWGNPLYRWDVLDERGYDWWVDRIQRATTHCDVVRIDHFRAFESYWAVPATAPNAIQGEWRDGPGDAFFDAMKEALGEVPFIAEDLGMITEAVTELRDRHELPGMKVMHFAFGNDPDHPFLPHTYPERCVAYLGTHDNDTTLGWYESADESIRHAVRTYFSHADEGIVWAMIEGLAASRADVVVVTPQDLFELGSEARLNTPGTSSDNWTWAMTETMLTEDKPWEMLGTTTRRHNRGSTHEA